MPEFIYLEIKFANSLTYFAICFIQYILLFIYWNYNYTRCFTATCQTQCTFNLRVHPSLNPRTQFANSGRHDAASACTVRVFTSSVDFVYTAGAFVNFTLLLFTYDLPYLEHLQKTSMEDGIRGSADFPGLLFFPLQVFLGVVVDSPNLPQFLSSVCHGTAALSVYFRWFFFYIPTFFGSYMKNNTAFVQGYNDFAQYLSNLW